MHCRKCPDLLNALRFESIVYGTEIHRNTRKVVSTYGVHLSLQFLHSPNYDMRVIAKTRTTMVNIKFKTKFVQDSTVNIKTSIVSAELSLL